MSGKISLDPGALDAASGNAAKLGDALEQAQKAIRGVSLAGLPPDALGRTQGVVASTSSQVGKAAQDADGQVGPLRKRAALARRADSWGGVWSTFLGDLTSAPSNYDLGGYLDSARTTFLGDIRNRIANNELARKKFKNAKKLWENEPWRQKQWSDPRKMFRELKRTPINQIRRGERIARYLDPNSLKALVPQGVRTAPLVRSIANSGVVRNPAVRRVTGKVPIIGSGIAYAGNKNDGKNRSNLDAAAKTVVQAGGAAVFGGVAATACGGATFLTAGAAAVVCPVTVIGAAALGDKVAGALYDPGKKAVGSVIGAGKKAWRWTGIG